MSSVPSSLSLILLAICSSLLLAAVSGSPSNSNHRHLFSRMGGTSAPKEAATIEALPDNFVIVEENQWPASNELIVPSSAYFISPEQIRQMSSTKRGIGPRPLRFGRR